MSVHAAKAQPEKQSWDGEAYDGVATPQYHWGVALLDHFPALPPGSRVLDAGCGSGRVTEALLERFPQVQVVALDASESMLAVAKRRLARHGERVFYLHADLRKSLSISPVDLVFSNATFQWVTDHDALFGHLAAVLGDEGRLIAQCAGAGNLARVSGVIARFGVDWAADKYFATAEETRRRLEQRGFADVQVDVVNLPTIFEDAKALRLFLEKVTLHRILEHLPERDRDPLVRAVSEALPDRTLDHVRLNIRARRVGRHRSE